ncbi:Alpha/Beta hydrolase protein [Cadophora sp. MPI-SDFR-AT-0126]|nr:Alpha/Beta hydrolase protein [Leotiomycetes sp. MPI-SDFR-AT-0126]
MSLYNVPTLPHLFRVDRKTSIPPPPSSSFDAQFGGVLPPAQILTTYHGKTTYYIIKPSHPSPPSSPRHVVLIHGVGTPAIGLLPLATILAASTTPTTVLIYDLWGHGLSSTPLATHTPGLFHTQILSLLSHLQWPRAHFIGFSFGGIIAASFTQFHTSAVESLVLIAPAGLLRRSNQSAWTRFLDFGGWGWGWESLSAERIYDFLGPGPVEENWQENLKGKGLNAIPRNAVQVWEKENHEGHVASLVSMYRYGGLYDMHETYRSVAESGMDTLVLLGETDGFFEKMYMMGELEKLGWKGEVRVVEGVGHGVVAEKTKETGDFVRKFWEGPGGK